MGRGTTGALSASEIATEPEMESPGSSSAAPIHSSLPKILLAEDQPAMRSLLARTLRAVGYDVVEFQDGVDLWSELNNPLADEDNPREAHLIISDIRMPGADGLEVLARFRNMNHATPVILMTAFGDQETLLKATQLGTTRVFNKPFDVKNLVAAAVSLVAPFVEPGHHVETP